MLTPNQRNTKKPNKSNANRSYTKFHKKKKKKNNLHQFYFFFIIIITIEFHNYIFKLNK